MYIKRTWYRNIGNLGKRVYNTVENYFTATLQCFQNAFSDKNFRLVLVHLATRYLQLIYCTEPWFLRSDSLLVLHKEPGWPHPSTENIDLLRCDLLPGIIGSCVRVRVCSGTQDSLCVLHFSSPLAVGHCSCGDEFPLQVSILVAQKVEVLRGLGQVDAGCVVASSCCFSLTFRFKCHLCSHSVQLFPICKTQIFGIA